MAWRFGWPGVAGDRNFADVAWAACNIRSEKMDVKHGKCDNSNLSFLFRNCVFLVCGVCACFWCVCAKTIVFNA